MFCKERFDVEQVVFFLLLRCTCTAWCLFALLPAYYLPAPAEDSAAQARRGRVGVQYSSPDLVFLRELEPLVLASEMP